MFFKIGVFKIHWKTPVLESFFDKVADPRKFHWKMPVLESYFIFF